MQAEDGHVLQLSRTWTELTGYTQADTPTFATGLTHEQSAGPGGDGNRAPQDAHGSAQTWLRTLSAGEVFDCEYRLRRADGAYRWFIGRIVPMKDDADPVVSWLGSATDIHELKTAQAELQEADRRKNHFLAMLGHE